MTSDSPVASLSARALASRKNGAKSRGPTTAAGKARSSRNALKHGLCASKLLVVPDEDAAAFAALEAALLDELAPAGALQAVLAQRVVSAAWRLMRADRFEAEVLEFRRLADGTLGLALIRDGNGTRSVDTAMRYRNAAMSELLRALKTLQAETRNTETRTARRSEPEQASRINASGEGPPQGTTACAAPNPGKRGDLGLPRRAPDHLDAAPKSASAGATKRTQERSPNQRLDPPDQRRPAA